MKTITIVTEQVSDSALSAALPADGVISLTISRERSVTPAAVEDYRAFRNPTRFNPIYRVELIVEDDAVESVFDGISFAYGAGVFSDAEAWIAGPALALSA